MGKPVHHALQSVFACRHFKAATALSPIPSARPVHDLLAACPGLTSVADCLHVSCMPLHEQCSLSALVTDDIARQMSMPAACSCLQSMGAPSISYYDLLSAS